MTGVLPDTDLSSRRLFDIVSVERGIAERARDPHRHRYYEVIWVRGGEGAHAVDFVDCPLEPGQVCIIAPGQIHQWHDNDFSGQILLFAQPLLDRETANRLKFGSGLAMRPDAPPVVALDEASLPDIQPLWQLLEREHESDRPDWHQVRPLLAALMAALAQIARRQTGLGLHRYGERIETLLKLVDRHFLEHRATAFYAGELGISAKRLNQITREVTGRTVLQTLHDRLLLEARRDLALTPRSVKAIGHRLGFEDASYFTRFFRTHTGGTPHAFRDAMRGLPQAALPFEERV